MVIERFEPGSLSAVHQRFTEKGRMLPKPVEYINSWMSTDGSRCYQLMEAPDERSLQPWMEQWSDLVRFEIVPSCDPPIFMSRGAWNTQPRVSSLSAPSPTLTGHLRGRPRSPRLPRRLPATESHS